MAALKASVGKAAYAYSDEHVGPRERVGNKGGTLGNRLRAVMAGKKSQSTIVRKRRRSTGTCLETAYAAVGHLENETYYARS